MKKKHAERSLTGLLAAWLLLMAVWLVPGQRMGADCAKRRRGNPRARGV